jgi:hypothetical protein
MNRSKLFIITAICLFAVSCDKDSPEPEPEPTVKPEFVIVATSGEASYLLQTDTLTKGELTIVNAGLETDNGTEWEFNRNTYLYRLQYNQGNAGTSSSYILNSAGRLEERSVANEIRNRFTTHGSFDKYVVTAAAVATDTKDADGNAAQGVTFTCIDTEAQTLATKTIVTENLLGNGEYVTFSGIVGSGGKLYTAVCPVGVSAYGSSTFGAGEVRTGTAYPDNVWIAVFDDVNFSNPRIISDDRLSYATSRFRSQYYTNLAVDDRENIYVFSAAYDANTTRPSGVLRINAGASGFDPSFFFNIEEVAGGRHLYKAFYISGDDFLLQLYSDAGKPAAVTTENSKKLAVFNAANLTFRWVTGLPAEENIGSIGKKVAVYDDTAYVAIVPVDGSQPAIYCVDAASATATKGVVVTCSSIVAVGRLGF